MKIAQITTVFPPYCGGIGQVAFNYAQGLNILGEEVEVLTVDFGKSMKFAWPVFYLKPWLKWGKAGFCPTLFSKLKKYDVIHLHYPSFGLAEVVWLWRKFNFKNKLIIFYHHDVVGSGLLGLIFTLHKKLIMPRILSSADRIIVSSFDYVKHSDIRGIYRKNMSKFVELPFGADEKFIDQKDKDILKDFNIDVNKKIILFVGGLDRNHYFKGADKLIQAVSELSTIDYHLILVGGGELIPDLKKLSEKLKVDNKITFTGWQSDAKLVKFYQAADLFVLASIDRSEAFGIVLIEAMACGLPVIASDLPGVRAVVKNNVTGLLVAPGDVDGLKQAIEKILTNDDIRNIYGQSAVERVNKNYRWDGIIKKLVGFYEI